MIENPIILALDTDSLQDAIDLVSDAKDLVWGFKIGLQFFSAFGIRGVEEIAKAGKPIFLDLKLHDIPSTVGKAVSVISKIERVKMLTIHACGGEVMIKAAVEAANENPELRILGVTVLTSCVPNPPEVKRLTRLAADCGAHGIICSGNAARSVRQEARDDFLIVSPGIRLEGKPRNDQTDVVTPREALANGANYIVIGRSVTESGNAAETLRTILGELKI